MQRNKRIKGVLHYEWKDRLSFLKIRLIDLEDQRSYGVHHLYSAKFIKEIQEKLNSTVLLKY